MTIQESAWQPLCGPRLLMMVFLSFLWGFWTKADAFALSGEHPEDAAIFLDGEMIRGRVAALLTEQISWAKGLNEVLDQLDGVDLIRKQEGLKVRVYLSQAVDFSWKKVSDTKRFELYRMRIPKEWEFEVASSEGRVLAKGLQSLDFYARIPAFSDRIEIDQIQVDLERSLAVLWVRALSGQLRLSFGFSWDQDGDSWRMLMRWWESLRLNLTEVKSHHF